MIINITDSETGCVSTYLYVEVDTIKRRLQQRSTRLAVSSKIDGAVNSDIIFKEEYNAVMYDMMEDFVRDLSRVIDPYTIGDCGAVEDVEWSESKVYYWELDTALEWREVAQQNASANLDGAIDAWLLKEWLSDRSVNSEMQILDYEKKNSALKTGFYNSVNINEILPTAL